MKMTQALRRALRRGETIPEEIPQEEPFEATPVTANKVRLHIIYDRENWAYHKRALALQKYAPAHYETTISRRIPSVPVDLVFNLKYGSAAGIRKELSQRFPQLGIRMVSSMNTGWPRNQDLLEKLLEVSQHVVINNVEMYENCGRLPRTSTISNGVDLSIFKPRSGITQRPKRVLWVGSEIHAKIKGYQRVVEVKQKLAERGIELDDKLVNSHDPIFNSEQMADWYNTGSVFIVASESEGTPNPALEAAGCGLAIVATKVGNMPELIEDRQNGVLVEKTADSIYEGVLYALEHRERLSNAVLQSIQSWDWSQRSKQFYSLFDELVRTNT